MLGGFFETCTEKGSELPLGHPSRKFKGRVCFMGDQVRDENFNIAIFQELSSSPATMQAGKIADAYGLVRGNSCEQSDAEQAYIQSKLGGDPTWVRVPSEHRPKPWDKYKDPVCPLVLALYGHPDSGGYWEKHCAAELTKGGFTLVPEWDSCYWHPQLVPRGLRG